MASRAAGVTFKVMTLAGTVGAGILARKVLSHTWKLAAGKEPPANPEDPEVSWQEAVGFALLSGASIGIARMLAGRQTAAWYKRKTGELPPGLQEATT
jgi:hypothetical protein